MFEAELSLLNSQFICHVVAALGRNLSILTAEVWKKIVEFRSDSNESLDKTWSDCVTI